MTNTLINPNPDASLNRRQLHRTNGSALLKVIVFNVGSLSCGLRIESIYKVLKQTQVYGSGLNSIGIAHMGERELVVVDLEQRLFQSSILNGSEQRGYLIVAQTVGEFFGIPVAAAPTLMEVPLATIRVLPESYRQADTLGIASHVAVIPQAETSMTLFLLDVDRLLTPRSGSSP